MTGFVGTVASISYTEEDDKENIQCSKFFVTYCLRKRVSGVGFGFLGGGVREKKVAAELRHL